MLTTAHFEHAAPIMAELDLETLLGAQVRLEAGDDKVLKDLMSSLATNAKSRTFRRLVAVVSASVEQLLEAELDAAKMTPLEADAARLPFKEAVQRVFGFFSELAPGAGAIQGFFGTPETQDSLAVTPVGSPSADS